MLSGLGRGLEAALPIPPASPHTARQRAGACLRVLDLIH